MFDLEALMKLGATESHLQLAKFLSEQEATAGFVDYLSLDLMQIAELVPDMWVIDFRPGIDDGLLLHFTGTRIDQRYGSNITGQRIEDIYSGHFEDQIMETYRKVYREKQGVFYVRNDFYERSSSQIVRRICTLIIPCSSDGETINFGIGLTTYEETDLLDIEDPEITFLSP